MKEAWLTAAIEEYKALNAEILQRNTQIFTITLASLAGIASVIGVSLHHDLRYRYGGIAILIIMGLFVIAFLITLNDTLLAWARLCEI
jgi:hypothetical protein